MKVYSSLTAAIVLAISTNTGYGQHGDPNPPTNVQSVQDHGHATVGPHHGSLIELGAEEYHAEFVHDEASGKVTIYILDSAAVSAVPIAATEIAINLKHDGKAEQFVLRAAPDAGDPAGMSSRFLSSDPELGEDLEHDGADAKLVVKIKGKSFRGTIVHDHHDDQQEDHDH
jgi:hypothetical protein